ncbi:uncharacterized protein LOC122375364 [Amphibalanus amphitrite]|uniref:uncharacterized protein LOC122375364 n=1 Tax=Amphibalanus amphitrite TaxID=1232801 RepID=UPI001C911EBE|nr:uncharacterized protein LOC122375364 [Amphibalanus amphitrite]
MVSGREPPSRGLVLVVRVVLVLTTLAVVHGTRRNKKTSIYDHVGGCWPGEVSYRLGEDIICYSLTPKLPFALALAACRNISGRLATIHSQEHNDVLYKMLNESAFIGAVARKHMVSHPLGDFGPGIIWSWMNGEAPVFTNVLQTETEGFFKQPDGGGFEGCMELMKHPVLENDPGNGFWGDTDCRAPKPALCARMGHVKRPLSKYPEKQWQFELRKDRRAACATGFSRVGVTWAGESHSRSTCLSERQDAGDFTEATRRCQEMNPTATVARPSRLAGRRRWVPSLSAGEVGLQWAGADRRNALFQWQWQVDGSRVPPSAWAAGEPRDGPGEDCAAYDPARRGMVATDCQNKLEFICETAAHGCASGFHVSATGLECVRDDWKDCDGSEEYVDTPNKKACTAKLCPLGCPSGYHQLGHKCLLVNDTASWFKENSNGCRKQMMRVMIPKDPTENEFLRRQTQRTGRPLWMVYSKATGFSRWHQYDSYGLPGEPNEPTTLPRRPVKISLTCPIIWFDGEAMDVDCFGEFPVVCQRLIKWKDCAEAVEKLKATL